MMMKIIRTPPKVVESLFNQFVFERFYSSSIESSLVQLSGDIEFVYNDLTQNTFYSLSRDEFESIQQRIINGLYVLSPLRIKIIRNEDVSRYIYITTYELHDFTILPCKHPGLSLVILPDHKDLLVFWGLGKMLYNLSNSSMPNDGYKSYNQIEHHYECIRQMGKADRLYNIDLEKSYLNMPNTLVLEKVKPFVGEGSVCYNIISSFFNLYGSDLKGHKMEFNGNMPIVGEISKVLFNLVLMDIFNREFAKRFPGIVFTRFIDQVYIASRNDEVLFDEKAGYELMKDLSLDGYIHSIGRGAESMNCVEKITIIDKYGMVVLFDPDDYSKFK